MYHFSCPHCGITIEAQVGTPGKRGKCPQCRNRVYLIGTDDPELREEFPFIQWVPCQDDRSSEAHLQLAKSGLLGKGYFLADDPAIEGWWIARRKGTRPCRCEVVLVDQLEAAVLELPHEFVQPPSFDPWSAQDDCELFGWGDDQSGYEDENYVHHPGNPELKSKSHQVHA